MIKTATVDSSPVILGPASEFVGRRKVLHISFATFLREHLPSLPLLSDKYSRQLPSRICQQHCRAPGLSLRDRFRGVGVSFRLGRGGVGCVPQSQSRDVSRFRLPKAGTRAESQPDDDMVRCTICRPNIWPDDLWFHQRVLDMALGVLRHHNLERHNDGSPSRTGPRDIRSRASSPKGDQVSTTVDRRGPKLTRIWAG